MAVIGFFVERYTQMIDNLLKIYRGVEKLHENLWDSGMRIVFVTPFYLLFVRRITSSPIEWIPYVSAFFLFCVILRLYQAQQKKKELENE